MKKIIVLIGIFCSLNCLGQQPKIDTVKCLLLITDTSIVNDKAHWVHGYKVIWADAVQYTFLDTREPPDECLDKNKKPFKKSVIVWALQLPRKN